MGDSEKALDYFQQAFQIYKNPFDASYAAGILANIGDIHLERGNIEEANTAYNKITYEQIGSEDAFERVDGIRLGRLGKLNLVKKNYQNAVKFFEESLKKNMKWKNANDIFSHYVSLGFSYEGLQKYKLAKEYYQKAIDLMEEIRSFFPEGERESFFVSRFEPYEGMVRLSEIKKESATGLFYAESTKARALIEGIAASARRSESPEIPAELIGKERILIAQLLQLDKTKEDAYKKGEEALKEHQERRNKAKAEMNELIAKLRREYPRYAALMYPKPFRVEELPLRDDEVLLEYELTEKAGYLFLVEKNKVKKIVKIPNSKKDIEALVNEFVRPIQSPYTKQGFSPSLGQKLYSILLEEALKDVLPEKKIIVVPDGILGVLPFEALVVRPGKDLTDTVFVGDKWKITYYQSATVMALQRLLKPSGAKKAFFGIGNPIYERNDPRYVAYKQGKPQPVMLAQSLSQYSYRGLATRREWGKTTKDDKEGGELVYAPLPETEDEVKTIANLFGVQPRPPDVLLGLWANETNLRKVPLQNYRYVHFATHADLPGKVQGIKEPFLLLG